jgi:hypothetical protein
MTKNISDITPEFRQAAREWAQAQIACAELQAQLVTLQDRLEVDPQATQRRCEDVIMQREELMRQSRAAARIIVAEMKSREQWNATFPTKAIQIALTISAQSPEHPLQLRIPYAQAADPDYGFWWVRNAKLALKSGAEFCRKISNDPLLSTLLPQPLQSLTGPQ